MNIVKMSVSDYIYTFIAYTIEHAIKNICMYTGKLIRNVHSIMPYPNWN